MHRENKQASEQKVSARSWWTGSNKKRLLLLAAMGPLILLPLFTAFALPATSGFTSGQFASIVIGQQGFSSGKNGSSEGQLNIPRGSAFDSSGNMWIADLSNSRVLEFEAPLTSGEFASVVIGQANFTSHKNETSQGGLYAPSGLTFDSSGNLWVADLGNNRVLEYTAPLSSGEFASIVLGQPDFTSSSNATTQSAFHLPGGLAFDSSGNLWVSDTGNNRVLEFKAPFTSDEMASAVIGQPDYTSNSATTTQSTLNSPLDITFDSSGNLWVADVNNNRVLEFVSPLTSDEPASLVIGQQSFTANTAATTPGGFSQPAAVAFDSGGNLWVPDASNNRVVEFGSPRTSGEFASLVLGQPSFTSGAATTTQGGMNVPAALSFGPDGSLWVTDENNNRILGFSNPDSTTSSVTTTVTSTITSTKTTTSTSITSLTSTTTVTTTKTTTKASPTCIRSLAYLKVGQTEKITCKSFPANSSVRYKLYDQSSHQLIANVVLGQKTSASGSISFSITITKNMIGNDLVSLYSPASSTATKAVVSFKTSS